jgi:hypothetical protein
MQIAVSYWHQRRDGTLMWARRVLEINPKHLLAGEFIAGVYWKLGDITGFAEANVRQATVFGVPDAALAHLRQVVEKMQDAFAAAGLSGVNRFMADQLTNERLEIDALPKVAFRRAVVYGAAGPLDEAFACLDQAVAFRDSALLHLAVAPQWDGLRDNSRFAERLKRMGLNTE